MLNYNMNEKVVRFPGRKIKEDLLPIQKNVPETVRPLSSQELQERDTFEKALIGVVFALRNVEAGRTALPDAEREAAKIINALKSKFGNGNA